ncbi:MAG: hypothetical protein CL607_23520 [Anaerolineaceae bacterium]|nr:hypothetical protein [Anaerolineaceae bacterium]
MSVWNTVLYFLLVLGRLTSPNYVCQPEIADIRFDGAYDIEVSAHLIQLYNEDQAIRQPGQDIDVAQLIEDDRIRREIVLDYLQAGQITRADDLYRAALIFQHGDCPAHYQLAADLAQRAYEDGYTSGGWLHAAAVDRYQQNTGRLPSYGTQYTLDIRGHFAQCPVDGSVTDDQRAELGVLSLRDLHARASSFDGQFQVEPSPWAVFTALPEIGPYIYQASLIWTCLH